MLHELFLFSDSQKLCTCLCSCMHSFFSSLSFQKDFEEHYHENNKPGISMHVQCNLAIIGYHTTSYQVSKNGAYSSKHLQLC